MAITVKFLRNIMTEARPIIERQMDDAKIIAGLRTVVANNGGDWGALKALIKAHIEDEADDDGEGKRVQKILDKADSSTVYADMLGLANMNENNFSDDQSYAEEKGGGEVVGITDATPHDPETGEITDNQESVGTVAVLSPSAAHGADESAAPITDQGINGPLIPVETATEMQAACMDRPDSLNSQPTSSPAVDMAGDLQDRNEPVSGSPASLSDDEVPSFLKADHPSQLPNPKCRKPGDCKWDHGVVSCWRCNSAPAREAVEA